MTEKVFSHQIQDTEYFSYNYISPKRKLVCYNHYVNSYWGPPPANLRRETVKPNYLSVATWDSGSLAKSAHVLSTAQSAKTVPIFILITVSEF